MARTRVRWGGAAAAVLALAIVANLAWAGASRAGVGGAQDASQARIYVVKQGDTVWGIARRIAGAEADPRPLVDQMVWVNHLEDAVIRPGQLLILPTGAASRP